jgi:LytS/YehU family sensor histidine kinase
LIENAVKHGVGRQSGTVEIALVIRLQDDRACIEVRNTGTLPERIGSGSGLTLSRERLRLLYGDDSDVSLRQDGDTVSVNVAWRPRRDAVAAVGYAAEHSTACDLSAGDTRITP